MKFKLELEKSERRERVHKNDLVNTEYILANSKVDDRLSVPENMVSEF